MKSIERLFSKLSCMHTSRMKFHANQEIRNEKAIKNRTLNSFGEIQLRMEFNGKLPLSKSKSDPQAPVNGAVRASMLTVLRKDLKSLFQRYSLGSRSIEQQWCQYCA